MPHLVLRGAVDFAAVAEVLESRLHRSGRTVLKTEGSWLKTDGGGLLVEGVVVEFSRPLHPVAVVMPRKRDTVIRLWPLAPVERNHSVQQWLVLVAAELQRCGAGELVSTNIPENLFAGFDLVSSPAR